MAIFNAFLYHPKKVTFESQEEGEKVYFILRRHPITNLGWILGSVFMLFIPLLLMEFLQRSGVNTFKYVPSQYQIALILIWYMLTMLFTFESFIIWYFNVYIITDKRLMDIDFGGFWRKRVSEAMLDKVEDVTYETNKFLHILFDYGNIFMQTAAERTEFEFQSIPKPAIVHDTLTNLVEDFKKHHGNK